MNKSVLESFIDILKSVNIDRYSIRYEGGNRTFDHNTESTLLYLKDDAVYGVETDPNYGSDTTNYNIRCIEYENIDNASVRGLTTKETIEVAKALGIYDDSLQNLIKNTGARINIGQIDTNRAPYSEIKDKDGNIILSTPLPGRVTVSD